MLELPSRRFFLGGLLAAPAIIKVAPLMKIVVPPLEPVLVTFEEWENLGEMIAGITRETFTPAIYAQMYYDHPLLSAFVDSRRAS